MFFIIQDFWATCDCPEKQSCSEIFHCIEILFIISGFLSILRLPWKTECALNSLYWIYIFYHSGFLSNLRLPWKTELPWNFSLHWIYIFIIQDFWATCACSEKQSCPEIFLCVEIFFIIQDFWATLRLPWKQSLPWNFSSRGLPPSHRLVRLCRMVKKEDELQFLHHFSFTYHLGCFVHSTRTQDGERTLSWHWNVCELSRIAFWNASLRSFWKQKCNTFQIWQLKVLDLL